MRPCADESQTRSCADEPQTSLCPIIALKLSTRARGMEQHGARPKLMGNICRRLLVSAPSSSSAVNRAVVTEPLMCCLVPLAVAAALSRAQRAISPCKCCIFCRLGIPMQDRTASRVHLRRWMCTGGQTRHHGLGSGPAQQASSQAALHNRARFITAQKALTESSVLCLQPCIHLARFGIGCKLQRQSRAPAASRTLVVPAWAPSLSLRCCRSMASSASSSSMKLSTQSRLTMCKGADAARQVSEMRSCR